jgi:hypothetical protein
MFFCLFALALSLCLDMPSLSLLLVVYAFMMSPCLDILVCASDSLWFFLALCFVAFARIFGCV